MNNKIISDVHVEWHEESYEPLWFVVEFPNGEERVIRRIQTQDKPTWVGACAQSRPDLLESTDYEDWYNEALKDAHGQGYVLEGEAGDDRPFTVTVFQSNPPYAPEAVLRLHAASEEDAKKKAAEWILKAYTIYAEEGHAREDQFEEDVRVIDIPDDPAPSKPQAASGRHTGLTVKATVTFQRWEGDIARFNGEAEFDACDALDSMSGEELAQIERNDPYALDNVYLRAVSFGQIHGYDGPFEVDLDEDNLSDYLEARRGGNHGI